MPPNNRSAFDYGSIDFSRRPLAGEDEQSLVNRTINNPIGNHKPPPSPPLANREARIAGVSFVITAVAIVAIYSFFANRDFDGYHQGAHLTTLPKRSKHIMLNKYYDEREMFFDLQAVDHMDPHNKDEYSHRFYKISKNWKGPGHPILVVLGGEDPLDLPMLYPYVYKGLATEFGAYVVSPEHRFYGKSQPVRHATNEELFKYLTPDQAMLDTINLIQYTRESIGCSLDKTSKNYCPVITFGASYPGFLSAMLRFRFPDVIDISYSASAPLNVHAQTVKPEAYFDKVTEVAEIAVPGCADAVRDTVYAARDELLDHYRKVWRAAEATGFCAHNFPHYIRDIPQFISEAITYLVPAVFADFNMGYYPPGPDRALERACHIFKSTQHSPLERISRFYDLRGEIEYGLARKPKCFDLSLELPDGPHATIRSADSTGSGGGFNGEIWEFQCCQDLVPRTAYSEASMFITRPYSMDWMKRHCEARFEGIKVRPYGMVRDWHFDDLSKASRMLFTNGLRDGWSAGSILESSNPNIAIINLPNGAHHSDLTQRYPDEEDTEDVIQAHEDAKEILRQWLEDIEAEKNIEN